MSDFSFSDGNGYWMRISYYSHPNPNLPAITLLPMVHLGEDGYYDEIMNEMWCHDTVYLEGSYMPGRRGLYLFHRLIAWRDKLSLQSGYIPFFRQWRTESKLSGKSKLKEWNRTFSCDCGNNNECESGYCFELKLRMVRADLHRWHAMKAIKAMPLWSKICFPFVILAALIISPFLNLRTYDYEDDETAEQHDIFDKFMAPYYKFARDDRDLFLRMVLAEEILNETNQNKQLCVKYGAKHMPTLVSTLLKDFNYKLTKQRSVLAIAKSKSTDLSIINTGYSIASEKLRKKISDIRQSKESMYGSYSVKYKYTQYGFDKN